MAFCENCGKDISDLARVCPGCGHPQGSLAVGPPVAGIPQAPVTSTNGMAIASLVLGIVWLWGIGAILALVFGYMGKSRIDQSHGRQSGRGLAIAGIVLGWIGVAGAILITILVVVVGSQASNNPSFYYGN